MSPSPSHYEGLHRRYRRILSDTPSLLAAMPDEDEIRSKLSSLFSGMMRAAYDSKASEFSVEILAEPAVRKFIDGHASILDSSFKQTSMSDHMRRQLHKSDWIFSGMKTFHELNEAFPSICDSNGVRKPFEQFLKDVQSVDSSYNARYLRAEYNFVAASAEMAAKWEDFARDGDRYNLQYRTQDDNHVRPEHAILNGITLPPSDPFWQQFYPPNGWNCRCTVVQVRKSKYPDTSSADAMALGEQALEADPKGMFRFNPGIEESTVPAYNPYTISKCRNCNIADLKESLAKNSSSRNQVCKMCRHLHDIDREKCELLKVRKKRHRDLLNDPSFEDIHFEKNNGGLRATHIGHITHSSKNEEIFFGKYTSTELENHCVETLFKMGHEAILCDESKRRPDGSTLTALDLMLNGRMMDIRSITTSRNYGNALVKKNKQLEKYNKRQDVDIPADAICLYFEDPSRFSDKKMRSSINYLKHFRDNKGALIDLNVRQVIVVLKNHPNMIVYDI